MDGFHVQSVFRPGSGSMDRYPKEGTLRYIEGSTAAILTIIYEGCEFENTMRICYNI